LAIYLCLQVFGDYVPYHSWLVEAANAHVFRVRDELVRPGIAGSDTSYNWAQFCLYLSLALGGSLAWGLLDRRRPSYHQANYWLRTLLRYYLARVALHYAFIKLYALQMPRPTLSEMSTLVGDLAPIRLLWISMGYSTPYQVFSGAMELLAGLLLLYRRTISLGLLVLLGVFANVAALNLFYDIPVKLFALHLVGYCLVLLAQDFGRLFSFLVLDRAAPASQLYSLHLPNRWWRAGRWAAKALVLVYVLLMPAYNGYTRIRTLRQYAAKPGPFGPVVYEVEGFRRNGAVVSTDDQTRWKDLVFDNSWGGSVNTVDTLFRQYYHRGYFTYQTDTINQVIRFGKKADTAQLFSLAYQLVEPDTLRLWGQVRHDSLWVELVKRPPHFQLTSPHFHWISDSPR
jgi:hypothetical protein